MPGLQQPGDGRIGTGQVQLVFEEVLRHRGDPLEWL